MKRFFSFLCALVFLAAAAIPTAALTPAYTVSGSYRNSDYHRHLLDLPRSGDGALDTVAVALTQLHYHEGNGTAEYAGLNQNGTGNYTEYGRAYGKVSGTYGYAWCAAFVTWCLTQAGEREAAGGAFVSCTLWVERLTALGLYRTRASGYTPQTGDLIFFRSAGVARASDHVGIVRGVSGGRVYTVEGNSSDRVTTHDYALTNERIVGYGTPQYTKKTLTVPTLLTENTHAGIYVVTHGTLNVRAGRGTTSAKRGVLTAGTPVRVTEAKNGWGTIDFEGRSAYVSLSFAAYAAPYPVRVRYGDLEMTYRSNETRNAPDSDAAGFVCWRSAEGETFAAGDPLPSRDLTLTAVIEVPPTPQSEETLPPETEISAGTVWETAENPEEAPPPETDALSPVSHDRATRAAGIVTALLTLAAGAAYLLAGNDEICKRIKKVFK